MGMYDGPDFETDEIEIVSIWVSKCNLNDIPDDYFEENYGGEDEESWNDFSSEFGFGYYDHDFVETYFIDDGEITHIKNLLEPLSYSDTFIDSAINAAIEKNLAETSFVFLIYNFEYSSKITGITESKYMSFLGAFPFKSDEEI